MEMSLAIKNKEAVGQLNYLLASDRGMVKDVMRIGDELLRISFDYLCDGFWVLGIGQGVEYYSPRFREVLGFEGEHDFPSVPESWQKQIHPDDLTLSTSNYNRHLADPKYPFYQEVRYKTKQGRWIKVICAGTICNRADPENLVMLGTHELIG